MVSVHHVFEVFLFVVEGIMKKILFSCVLGAALALSAAVDTAQLGDDVMAFYPFMDGAAGNDLPVGVSNPSIHNAVNAENYIGTAYRSTAYGTAESPSYSDDLPAAYLYANAAAEEPICGVGEWQSISFPDLCAGSTNNADGVSFFFPLATNAAARTVTVTYRDSANGSPRQQGATSISFADLDSALAQSGTWTVECFYKHVSAHTSQGLFFADSYAKLKCYSCYGTWDQFVYQADNGSAYKNYGYIPPSFNFAEAGWQHLALVRNAEGTFTVYLNYEKIAEKTLTLVDPGDKRAPLFLGDYRTNFPGNPFYGKVAALRVTKRALAKNEFLVARATGSVVRKTISGDYEVPAAGETINELTITGNARITGGALALAGNVTISAGSEVTFANAGVALPENSITVTAREGSVMRFLAPLSGTKDLTLDGAGTIYLTAASPDFAGGIKLMGDVTCHVQNDLALGDTAQGTMLIAPANLYLDGVDLSEPISYSQLAAGKSSGDGTAYIHFSANTTNILRGTVTRLSGRGNYGFEAHSYTILSNAVPSADYVNHQAANTATVEVWGDITEGRVNYGSATVHFHSRHSAMSGANYGIDVANAYTKYIMEMKNVFAASDDATAAVANAYPRFSGAGTFDLNGYDQRVTAISGDKEGIITSASPATLYVDSKVEPGANTSRTAGHNQFNGIFSGAVSLCVDGAVVPLDLYGVSTSTGEVEARNGGQIYFKGTGAWNGSAVKVTGTGSLIAFAAADAVGPDTEVCISDGGGIQANSTISLSRVTVGGQPLEGGTYGAVGSGAAHEVAWLTGSGLLLVAQQAAATRVWNAAGASTDLTLADNWENGLPPDFQLGLDTACFSTAGERATVASAVKLFGIVLDRPESGGFTFAAAEGGQFGLSAGGFSGEEERLDAGRHYTNSVPTQLMSAQNWIFPATATEFVQAAPLSGEEDASITLKGNADIHLMADNSAFKGDLNLASDQVKSGCVVHVWHDHALGSGDFGQVLVTPQYTGNNPYKASKLVFHGERVIDRAIVGGTQDAPYFEVPASNRVTFTRQFLGNSIIRPVLGTGAEVVFAGGYRTSCLRVAPPIAGAIVVTNTSADIGSFNGTIYSNAQADRGRLAIYTSNNTYASHYGFEYGGNILIDLHAENAIGRMAYSHDSLPGGYAPKITISKGSLLWPEYRLNGFDQNCAYLEQKADSVGSATAQYHARITSDKPAQLDVLQTPDKTFDCLAFEGAAGLTLRGEGTLTLNAITNDTTGRLVVDGGHLALGAGAAWPNVSEVTLQNAGTLTLAADKLFGRDVTKLSLETGTSLDIGSTRQIVHELAIDGVAVPPRVKKPYTAASPELKGLVTGTGSITVYGTGLSMRIYVR